MQSTLPAFITRARATPNFGIQGRLIFLSQPHSEYVVLSPNFTERVCVTRNYLHTAQLAMFQIKEHLSVLFWSGCNLVTSQILESLFVFQSTTVCLRSPHAPTGTSNRNLSCEEQILASFIWSRKNGNVLVPRATFYASISRISSP